MYSQKVMMASQQVVVVETANDWDQSEIVCPDVINPGEYFVCKIDIPFGNGLTATVAMADDIYPVANISTGAMNVPGDFRLAFYNRNELFLIASQPLILI